MQIIEEDGWDLGLLCCFDSYYDESIDDGACRDPTFIIIDINEQS